MKFHDFDGRCPNCFRTMKREERSPAALAAGADSTPFYLCEDFGHVVKIGPLSCKASSFPPELCVIVIETDPVYVFEFREEETNIMFGNFIVENRKLKGTDPTKKMHHKGSAFYPKTTEDLNSIIGAVVNGYVYDMEKPASKMKN